MRGICCRQGTRALFAGALVTVACVAAAPAQAATPFSVVSDPGASWPNAAIDAAGNAHVVWRADLTPPGVDPSDQLRYCIVRPTGSGCDPAAVKSFHPGGDAEHVKAYSPHAFVTPAGEIVLAATFATVDRSSVGVRSWAWRSSDGGATFGPPVALTPGIPTSQSNLQSMALGPGEAVSVMDNHHRFVRGPLAGGPPTSHANLISKFNHSETFGANPERVAVVDDSRPVGISIKDGGLEYAYYGGSGDHNDPASWVGPVVLHPSGSDLGLDAWVAGGPTGLVVVYELGNAFVARKLDPATMRFGAPVTIIPERGVVKDLYSDPLTGGFHVIYLAGGKLRWVGSADGVSWTKSMLLGDYPDGLWHQVAAGARGTGIVVWEHANSEIRAQRLEPIDDSGPDETGAKGDPCKPPSCSPTGGRNKKAIGNRLFEENVVVSDCAKRRVTLRVRTKRRQARGQWRIRVRKVVFRLDRQRRKVDRRPPYRVRYSLRQHGLPNSKHTARAVVHLRVRKGTGRPRSRKVALVKKFRLCPFA